MIFLNFMCFFYFSVMQKEPRRQRFFRESRQTILQKSRQNGNLEAKSRNVHKTKKRIVGIFNLIFITFSSWVKKVPRKTSLWKYRENEDVMKSFFILTTKKYLLTNFTLQFLLLLCLHKWIFVKFQKISVRKFSLIFFSNNFSPVKICRLVQEKNCLFSTSKNLWIFLDLNFLTIFTQKMYLHAKRIFKVRKKFYGKNLLKNWEMSKNSKNFAMKKKITIQNF